MSYDVPRPKRSDFVYPLFGGKKWFDSGSYNAAVSNWQFERNRHNQTQRQSNWTPRASQAPDVGVVAGTDDPVSFKTGGPSGEETLISDGDYSDDNDGFSTHHDHHGRHRSKGRGHYSGPNS